MAAKQQKQQKELRKMSRTELIEIIYDLQQDEKNLRAEIDELKQRLEEKLICIENSGSIAEAALKLNHIFQDAENAARQYIESVKAGAEKTAGPAEENPKGV